jgi:SAM-dependent methyltransferase
VIRAWLHDLRGRAAPRVRTPPDISDISNGYDIAADGYDDRHGDRRSAARTRVIERPLREATRGARRVLDLGCGTGRALAELSAPVRLGVDVSHKMLRIARARGHTVARADAHALPLADGAIDAIVAAKGVFRYLDYPRAFAECARVLARGGRLGVHQYAARTWQLRRVPDDGAALHVGSVDELIEPAARSGLTLESATLWRAVRLPPYAVAIPRWPRNRLWNHCTLVFRK